MGYQGPAHVFKLRGALDERGKLVALEYDACSADYNHLWYNEPDTVLIAQLMGLRPSQPAKGNRRNCDHDVRHSESARDDPDRRHAVDLGNAATNWKSARSQRPAGHLCLRILH